MSLLIAWVIIGLVSFVGFLVDADGLRFNRDSITDWISRSIVFVIVVAAWPYFYYEKSKVSV